MSEKTRKTANIKKGTWATPTLYSVGNVVICDGQRVVITKMACSTVNADTKY